MSQELKGTLSARGNLVGQLGVGGVAGTDNYPDLNNLPQINGVTLIDNKSSEELGINIPTKTSDLENDSGFITSDDLPTKVSELENDSGFITSEDLPTKVSDLENDSGFVTIEDVINDTISSDNQAYSSDKVEELIDSLLPVDTSSGLVASFSTDLAKPLVSLKADVNAIQDLHGQSGAHPYSNICPIYGWNQVNVTHCGNKYTPNIKPFNEWEIARSDYYISRFSVPNAIITVNLIDKDTTVDLTGVAFGFVDSYWNKNNPITTNEYRWFIQNGTPQTTKKNIAIADASKILTGLIFAPQTEEAYNKLMARYDYEFVFSETSNNEAYNGNTEVINLGDTIYGGYVTQDNNGLKLVVTHKALRLSTLTDWSRITNYTNPFFRATLPTDCKVRTSSSNPQIAICDSYTWFSSNQNYWQYIGNYEFVTAGFGVSYVNRVYIRNDDYTDKDSFITSLSGVYIVYELTTPIEIPLSDIPQLTTLIGTNNIFADSGDVEVKFKKSIQKYIDDKIAETQALIL